MTDDSLFGSSASDPSAQLVRELLSGLNTAVPQPPNKPGKVRSIMGALGDALLTAGVARGGGQAQQPGPYLRTVLGQQQAYRQQLAQEENRRTQTLEALARLQDQQEQRAISNQFRAAQIGKPKVTTFERDVSGEPHTIRQVLNPASGEVLDEIDLGPKFVAPSIAPGVSGGKEGIFKIPRTSRGAATPVGTEAGGAALTPSNRPRTRVVYDKAGNVYEQDEDTKVVTPILLPGGGQAGRPISPVTDINVQSSLNSLNLAADTLKEMRANYVAGVSAHGAFERLGASGAMATPGVRSITGYLDAGARTHDAKRRLLNIELNKAISGQNRVLESVLRGILEAIPPYGEAPAVALPLYNDLERTIDNARAATLSAPHNPGAADIAAGNLVPAHPQSGERPLSEMSIEELRALRARIAGQR